MIRTPNKRFEPDSQKRCDATQELLQAYYEALAAARKRPVRDCEVSFQVELSVSP